jgi:hypothetical protein
MSTLTGRQSILIPITGFAVAYVRHGLTTRWAWWLSVGDLLGSWVVHTVALVFFLVIAGATIC